MELFDYQQDIFDRFKDTNRACIFTDTGTGKTVISMALIKHWKPDNLIVLCVKPDRPKWAKEIDGIEIKSGEMLKKNYGENRIAMTHQLASVHLDAVINNMTGTIGIIVDESYKFKTATSKLAKMLFKCKPMLDYRVILTATPSSIGYIDLFTQVKFVWNDHETPEHFRTKKAFESRYCIKEIPPWLKEIIPAPIIVGYKNEEEMLTTINTIAVYADKNDVLSLPEKHEIDIKITYGNVYDEMLKTLKEEHYLTNIQGEEIFFDSMGASLAAIRQFRSGIVDNQVMFKEKFIETIRIIKEHERGVIIFCEFKNEANYLVQAIEHYFKRPVGKIYGDNIELDNKFVTVCTYSKAAESIDGLQHRNNVFVHFCPTDKWIKYEQSRGRIYRYGQKKECYFYRLILKNQEEKNYDALQKKQDFVINLQKNWKDVL